MRTSTNIGLQTTAYVLALTICLAAPGSSLLAYVFTPIGLLVTLAPLIFAVAIRKRGRIDPAVRAPFLVAAALLVTAAAFRHEDDAHGGFVPAVRLFAPGAAPSAAIEEFLWMVGPCALVGFLGALLWIAVAAAAAGLDSAAVHLGEPARL
ncbi:hypothetical protein [Pseudonocardia humida]|uniref:Uncharacterized protein n=1 Tax=Pseudonocardia humida TaxID=2800819 RepID=A0ABT1A2L2_9PSEU|nr:hypothetical protein [Pseudonocardia humida]MCO1657155.1 hypothetical protein [Pseudonocardia humida]